MLFEEEMDVEYIRNYAKDIHNNENRKWWYDEKTGEPINPSLIQKKMLIISELFEAFEGFRKNLNDDKLPKYKMFDVELADFVIRILDFYVGKCSDHNNWPNATNYTYEDRFDVENFYQELSFLNYLNNLINDVFLHVGLPCEEELFTAVYAVFDYMHFKKIPFGQIVHEKREYNKNRSDHKKSERDKENGKKF